jgi:predicted acyltransferase (DUF342 family)
MGEILRDPWKRWSLSRLLGAYLKSLDSRGKGRSISQSVESVKSEREEPAKIPNGTQVSS